MAVNGRAALAQSEPATEHAATPAAGINAASVDGKSAVGFTNKRGPRRGKLVATNAQGELPSKIVRPYWGFIKNKPGILADHAIGWNEVQGIPAGLADGLDDQGVAHLKFQKAYGPKKTVGAGKTAQVEAACPGGMVAMSAGFGAHTGEVAQAVYSDVYAYGITSTPNGSSWAVNVKNIGSTEATVQANAVCLSAAPRGSITWTN